MALRVGKYEGFGDRIDYETLDHVALNSVLDSNDEIKRTIHEEVSQILSRSKYGNLFSYTMLIRAANYQKCGVTPIPQKKETQNETESIHSSCDNAQLSNLSSNHLIQILHTIIHIPSNILASLSRLSFPFASMYQRNVMEFTQSCGLNQSKLMDDRRVNLFPETDGSSSESFAYLFWQLIISMVISLGDRSWSSSVMSECQSMASQLYSIQYPLLSGIPLHLSSSRMQTKAEVSLHPLTHYCTIIKIEKNIYKINPSPSSSKAQAYVASMPLKGHQLIMKVKLTKGTNIVLGISDRNDILNRVDQLMNSSGGYDTKSFPTLEQLVLVGWRVNENSLILNNGESSMQYGLRDTEFVSSDSSISSNESGNMSSTFISAKEGDVVGMLSDIDNKRIRFTLNGNDMGSIYVGFNLQSQFFQVLICDSQCSCLLMYEESKLIATQEHVSPTQPTVEASNGLWTSNYQMYGDTLRESPSPWMNSCDKVLHLNSNSLQFNNVSWSLESVCSLKFRFWKIASHQFVPLLSLANSIVSMSVGCYQNQMAVCFSQDSEPFVFSSLFVKTGEWYELGVQFPASTGVPNMCDMICHMKSVDGTFESYRSNVLETTSRSLKSFSSVLIGYSENMSHVLELSPSVSQLLGSSEMDVDDFSLTEYSFLRFYIQYFFFPCSPTDDPSTKKSEPSSLLMSAQIGRGQMTVSESSLVAGAETVQPTASVESGVRNQFRQGETAIVYGVQDRCLCPCFVHGMNRIELTNRCDILVTDRFIRSLSSTDMSLDVLEQSSQTTYHESVMDENECSIRRLQLKTIQDLLQWYYAQQCKYFMSLRVKKSFMSDLCDIPLPFPIHSLSRYLVLLLCSFKNLVDMPTRSQEETNRQSECLVLVSRLIDQALQLDMPLNDTSVAMCLFSTMVHQISSYKSRICASFFDHEHPCKIVKNAMFYDVDSVKCNDTFLSEENQSDEEVVPSCFDNASFQTSCYFTYYCQLIDITKSILSCHFNKLFVSSVSKLHFLTQLSYQLNQIVKSNRDSDSDALVSVDSSLENMFKSVLDNVCEYVSRDPVAKKEWIPNKNTIKWDSIRQILDVENFKFDPSLSSNGIRINPHGDEITCVNEVKLKTNIAFVNTLMHTGVFTFTFVLEADRFNDEMTCFGALISPHTNSNLDYNSNLYIYRCFNGFLFNRGSRQSTTLEPLHQGGHITMVFDMNRCTISMNINGRDYGVVFRDISGPLYPVVTFYNTRLPARSVRLIKAGYVGDKQYQSIPLRSQSVDVSRSLNPSETCKMSESELLLVQLIENLLFCYMFYRSPQILSLLHVINRRLFHFPTLLESDITHAEKAPSAISSVPSIPISQWCDQYDECPNEEKHSLSILNTYLMDKSLFSCHSISGSSLQVTHQCDPQWVTIPLDRHQLSSYVINIHYQVSSCQVPSRYRMESSSFDSYSSTEMNPLIFHAHDDSQRDSGPIHGVYHQPCFVVGLLNIQEVEGNSDRHALNSYIGSDSSGVGITHFGHVIRGNLLVKSFQSSVQSDCSVFDCCSQPFPNQHKELFMSISYNSDSGKFMLCKRGQVCENCEILDNLPPNMVPAISLFYPGDSITVEIHELKCQSEQSGVARSAVKWRDLLKNEDMQMIKPFSLMCLEYISVFLRSAILFVQQKLYLDNLSYLHDLTIPILALLSLSSPENSSQLYGSIHDSIVRFIELVDSHRVSLLSDSLVVPCACVGVESKQQILCTLDEIQMYLSNLFGKICYFASESFSTISSIMNLDVPLYFLLQRGLKMSCIPHAGDDPRMSSIKCPNSISIGGGGEINHDSQGQGLADEMCLSSHEGDVSHFIIELWKGESPRVQHFFSFLCMQAPLPRSLTASHKLDIQFLHRSFVCLAIYHLGITELVLAYCNALSPSMDVQSDPSRVSACNIKSRNILAESPHILRTIFQRAVLTCSTIRESLNMGPQAVGFDSTPLPEANSGSQFMRFADPPRAQENRHSDDGYDDESIDPNGTYSPEMQRSGMHVEEEMNEEESMQARNQGGGTHLERSHSAPLMSSESSADHLTAFKTQAIENHWTKHIQRVSDAVSLLLTLVEPMFELRETVYEHELRFSIVRSLSSIDLEEYMNSVTPDVQKLYRVGKIVAMNSIFESVDKVLREPFECEYVTNCLSTLTNTIIRQTEVFRSLASVISHFSASTPSYTRIAVLRWFPLPVIPERSAFGLQQSSDGSLRSVDSVQYRGTRSIQSRRTQSTEIMNKDLRSILVMEFQKLYYVIASHIKQAIESFDTLSTMDEKRLVDLDSEYVFMLACWRFPLNVASINILSSTGLISSIQSYLNSLSSPHFGMNQRDKSPFYSNHVTSQPLSLEMTLRILILFLIHASSMKSNESHSQTSELLVEGGVMSELDYDFIPSVRSRGTRPSSTMSHNSHSKSQSFISGIYECIYSYMNRLTSSMVVYPKPEFARDLKGFLKSLVLLITKTEESVHLASFQWVSLIMRQMESGISGIQNECIMILSSLLPRLPVDDVITSVNCGIVRILLKYVHCYFPLSTGQTACKQLIVEELSSNFALSHNCIILLRSLLTHKNWSSLVESELHDPLTRLLRKHESSNTSNILDLIDLKMYLELMSVCSVLAGDLCFPYVGMHVGYVSVNELKDLPPDTIQDEKYMHYDAVISSFDIELNHVDISIPGKAEVIHTDFASIELMDMDSSVHLVNEALALDVMKLASVYTESIALNPRSKPENIPLHHQLLFSSILRCVLCILSSKNMNVSQMCCFSSQSLSALFMLANCPTNSCGLGCLPQLMVILLLQTAFLSASQYSSRCIRRLCSLSCSPLCSRNVEVSAFPTNSSHNEQLVNGISGWDYYRGNQWHACAASDNDLFSALIHSNIHSIVVQAIDNNQYLLDVTKLTLFHSPTRETIVLRQKIREYSVEDCFQEMMDELGLGEEDSASSPSLHRQGQSTYAILHEILQSLGFCPNVKNIVGPDTEGLDNPGGVVTQTEVKSCLSGLGANVCSHGMDLDTMDTHHSGCIEDSSSHSSSSTGSKYSDSDELLTSPNPLIQESNTSVGQIHSLPTLNGLSSNAFYPFEPSPLHRSEDFSSFHPKDKYFGATNPWEFISNHGSLSQGEIKMRNNLFPSMWFDPESVGSSNLSKKSMEYEPEALSSMLSATRNHICILVSKMVTICARAVMTCYISKVPISCCALSTDVYPSIWTNMKIVTVQTVPRPLFAAEFVNSGDTHSMRSQVLKSFVCDVFSMSSGMGSESNSSQEHCGRETMECMQIMKRTIMDDVMCQIKRVIDVNIGDSTDYRSEPYYCTDLHIATNAYVQFLVWFSTIVYSSDLSDQRYHELYLFIWTQWIVVLLSGTNSLFIKHIALTMLNFLASLLEASFIVVGKVVGTLTRSSSVSDLDHAIVLKTLHILVLLQAIRNSLSYDRLVQVAESALREEMETWPLFSRYVQAIADFNSRFKYIHDLVKVNEGYIGYLSKETGSQITEVPIPCSIGNSDSLQTQYLLCMKEGGHVCLNNRSVSPSWTVELWIKILPNQSSKQFILFSNDSCQLSIKRQNDDDSDMSTLDSWVVCICSETGAVTLSYSLPLNEFFHLAIINNSSNRLVSLYVNGECVEMKMYLLQLPLLTLGRRESDCMVHIKEMRVWRIVRSKHEIKRFMYKSLDPKRFNHFLTLYIPVSNPYSLIGQDQLNDGHIWNMQNCFIQIDNEHSLSKMVVGEEYVVHRCVGHWIHDIQSLLRGKWKQGWKSPADLQLLIQGKCLPSEDTKTSQYSSMLYLPDACIIVSMRNPTSNSIRLPLELGSSFQLVTNEIFCSPEEDEKWIPFLKLDCCVSKLYPLTVDIHWKAEYRQFELTKSLSHSGMSSFSDIPSKIVFHKTLHPSYLLVDSVRDRVVNNSDVKQWGVALCVIAEEDAENPCPSGISSGIYCWDMYMERCTTQYIGVGVATIGSKLSSYLGRDFTGWSFQPTNEKWHANVGSQFGPMRPSYQQGDTISAELNMDDGTLGYYKNNEYLGIAFTGLDKIEASVTGLLPAVTCYRTGDSIVCRGLKNGSGEFRYPSNDVEGRLSWTGRWANGQKHGYASVFFRDGRLQHCSFKRGFQEALAVEVSLHVSTEALDASQPNALAYIQVLSNVLASGGGKDLPPLHPSSQSNSDQLYVYKKVLWYEHDKCKGLATRDQIQKFVSNNRLFDQYSKEQIFDLLIMRIRTWSNSNGHYSTPPVGSNSNNNNNTNHGCNDDGDPEINPSDGRNLDDSGDSYQQSGIFVKGSACLNSDNLFVLSKEHCAEGIVLSDDLLTATCSMNNRCMVLGSTGFTNGKYYWEVKVEKCSFGSMFIGVASHLPGSSHQCWRDYGFVNNRTIQDHSTESYYGANYNANDVIGVFLDMDNGFLAFYKIGEDFYLSQSSICYYGVGCRRVRSGDEFSPQANVVFPSFGFKNTGDKISITQMKCVRDMARSPSQILSNYVDLIELLHPLSIHIHSPLTSPPSSSVKPQEMSPDLTSMNDTFGVGEMCFDSAFCSRVFSSDECKDLMEGRIRVETRGNLNVLLETNPKLFEELLNHSNGCGCSDIGPGSILSYMNHRYEIVGIHDGHVWYREEGTPTCMYFTHQQLVCITNSTSTTTDNTNRIQWITGKRFIADNIYKNIVMKNKGCLCISKELLGLVFEYINSLCKYKGIAYCHITLELLINPSHLLQGRFERLLLLLGMNVCHSSPHSLQCMVDKWLFSGQLSSQQRNDLESNGEMHENLIQQTKDALSLLVFCTIYLQVINDKIRYSLALIDFKMDPIHNILNPRCRRESQIDISSVDQWIRESMNRQERSSIFHSMSSDVFERHSSTFEMSGGQLMNSRGGSKISSTGVYECSSDIRDLVQSSIIGDHGFWSQYAMKRIFVHKQLFFAYVKKDFWNSILEVTSSVTPIPQDAYERPMSIPEIPVNRISAWFAESKNASLSEIRDRSLLSQLIKGLERYPMKHFRREYCQAQHAGQKRAFFVHLIGEGVYDSGGPYRSILETVVSHEPFGRLKLARPCPNAENQCGMNRDTYVLSASEFDAVKDDEVLSGVDFPDQTDSVHSATSNDLNMANNEMTNANETIGIEGTSDQNGNLVEQVIPTNSAFPTMILAATPHDTSVGTHGVEVMMASSLTSRSGVSLSPATRITTRRNQHTHSLSDNFIGGANVESGVNPLGNRQNPVVHPSSNSRINTSIVSHGVSNTEEPMKRLTDFEQLFRMYFYWGVFLASSQRHNVMCNIPLYPMFWKVVVGERLNVNDLLSIDHTFVNTLQYWKDMVSEMDDGINSESKVLNEISLLEQLLGRSFVLKFKQLILQGQTEKWMKQAILWYLNRELQYIGIMKLGMNQVVPLEVAYMFTTSEYNELVCGSAEFSALKLKQIAEYHGDVDPLTNPAIIHFWEAVERFTDYECCQLLEFVCARSRIPLPPSPPISFKIDLVEYPPNINPDRYLPQSQTCFSLLKLPTYSSSDIAYRQLLYAMQNTPTMELDVNVHNAEGWEGI